MPATHGLQPPRPRWLLVSVLTALLSLTAQAPAQTQPSTRNSSDVVFHAGIKNGKSQFYLGEVIPLELTFTSKMPKRYQINMARYDRSGRMSYEQFSVNPDGSWGDPLRSYFNSSMGWMGGGLTGFEFLSESPTKISLELNEWVQFHRAGKYRVTVQTSRVGEISGEASSPFDKPVSLTSNELELTIVSPTTSWQEQTLVQALAALDASARDPAKAVANPAELSPRHQALKTLRYLGTASAAKELARHLRGEDSNFDFECMFGLVGSPQHEAALSEMRRLLADPDHPVTDLFLVTMSVLSLNKDESPEVLRSQREQRYQAIHAEFLDDLPHKRGNALAVSLYTALNQVGPQQAIPPEKGEQLAAQLPAIFDRLPVEKQYELLAYDPWGNLLNRNDPTGTRDKFKFTGEALDPQTGLYFLRARYYDPSIGRFICKDPFPGFVTLPSTANNYAYALDNPVSMVDPSGLAAEPVGSASVSFLSTLDFQPSFVVPAPNSLDWAVPESPTQNFENLVENEGHVLDAYNLLAHGDPPLPFADLWDLFSGSVGKTLSSAFGVFGYLMNPQEIACQAPWEACAGSLTPAAQQYLFSNVDAISPTTPGMIVAPLPDLNLLLQPPATSYESDFTVFVSSGP